MSLELEYAVVCKHPKDGMLFSGPGLGASWDPDYQRVKEHYDYVTGPWRTEQEQLAEEEDLSRTNWAHMNWANNKLKKFAVVKRKVEPMEWLEKEEGFDD